MLNWNIGKSVRRLFRNRKYEMLRDLVETQAAELSDLKIQIAEKEDLSGQLETVIREKQAELRKTQRRVYLLQGELVSAQATLAGAERSGTYE